MVVENALRVDQTLPSYQCRTAVVLISYWQSWTDKDRELRPRSDGLATIMTDRGGLLWSGTSAKNDRHSVTWALKHEMMADVGNLISFQFLMISISNQWREGISLNGKDTMRTPFAQLVRKRPPCCTPNTYLGAHRCLFGKSIAENLGCILLIGMYWNVPLMRYRQVYVRCYVCHTTGALPAIFCWNVYFHQTF